MKESTLFLFETKSGVSFFLQNFDSQYFFN